MLSPDTYFEENTLRVGKRLCVEAEELVRDYFSNPESHLVTYGAGGEGSEE